MNSNATSILGQYSAGLQLLTQIDLIMLVSRLALRQVDDYINAHPLPEGADPDEARAIMLVIAVTRALEQIDREMRPDTSALTNDEVKAIADAAIAKAQGKTQ